MPSLDRCLFHVDIDGGVEDLLDRVAAGLGNAVGDLAAGPHRHHRGLIERGIAELVQDDLVAAGLKAIDDVLGAAGARRGGRGRSGQSAITADKAVAATVANVNLFIVVPSFFCFRF